MDSFELDPQVKNFVFLGEAGSGKSEIAMNFAQLLLLRGDLPVHFFDLDMTKPLFRSRDQSEALSKLGIQVHFEVQFMDAPTAAGGVRSQLQNEDCYTILDVGGDFIGARAIGGYASLLNAPNTAVYYVINPFRPWSTDLTRIDHVLGETLGVSHIKLEQLHLVGNPNFGIHTTAEQVQEGYQLLLDMVSPYKDFDFFCVWEPLYSNVRGDFSHALLPLKLSLSYPWNP